MNQQELTQVVDEALERERDHGVRVVDLDAEPVLHLGLEPDQLHRVEAVLAERPVVQLAGTKEAVRIHELYSPEAEPPGPRPHPTDWQEAMDAFDRGDWNETREKLKRSFDHIPEHVWQGDGVVKMIHQWMSQNDGSKKVIELEKK